MGIRAVLGVGYRGIVGTNSGFGVWVQARTTKTRKQVQDGKDHRDEKMIPKQFPRIPSSLSTAFRIPLLFRRFRRGS